MNHESPITNHDGCGRGRGCGGGNQESQSRVVSLSVGRTPITNMNRNCTAEQGQIHDLRLRSQHPTEAAQRHKIHDSSCELFY